MDRIIVGFKKEDKQKATKIQEKNRLIQTDVLTFNLIFKCTCSQILFFLGVSFLALTGHKELLDDAI